MKSTNNSVILRFAVTVALSLAIIGSSCLAVAFTHAHIANISAFSFPAELKGLTPDTQREAIIKPDVISRPYLSSTGSKMQVIVQRNKASAVLHDLTSCLINGNAKPRIVESETVKTRWGDLNCSLVAYELKNRQCLALMWFQKGSHSAHDRWSWRWLSTFSNEIRDSPTYYQAEVCMHAGDNRAKDLAILQDAAVRVFEELADN